MKKIAGFCFLVAFWCEFAYAQPSLSYFLMDKRPVYLQKIDREALLILESNASDVKNQKHSTKISQTIRRYGNPSLASESHQVLQFRAKSPPNFSSLRQKLALEDQFKALYPAYDMAGVRVFLTNRLLLKIRSQADILTLHLFLDNYGVSLQEFHPTEDGLLCFVELPESVDIFEITHKLDQREEVIYAEPDLILTSPSGFYESEPQICPSISNNDLPNDPDFSKQWFLHQESDADLDAPEAWAIHPGDSQVVVAVIDLHGYDLKHEDLSNNIISPYNAAFNNTHPAPQNQYARHGTPCAGLITASTHNNLGIAGIGNKIKVMPILIGEEVRSDGLTYVRSSAYIRAAEHIVKTPNVVAVSNSFATTSLTNTIRTSYQRMQKETRKGLGAVILASSGNWNRKNQVIYPYYLPGVIGVGATNFKDTRTGFSNYGDSLDLVAPGEGIFTTLNGDNYGYFGGTSASSPLAAGLVGLMASVRPNLNAAQLGKVLLESCDKTGNYVYAPRSNFIHGDWNEEMGYGRINALKALETIQKLNPPSAPFVKNIEVLSNHEISVHWQDTCIRSQGFVVERSEENNQNFIRIATLESENTTFRDATLKENTRYFYRILAFNQDGFSPYSKEIFAITQGKPTAPQNLQARAESSQKIVLTWDSPIGNGEVEQWELRRYLHQQEVQVIDTIFKFPETPAPNQFTDSSLVVLELYAYELIASNHYGTSPLSNLVKVPLGVIILAKDTLLNTCQDILLDPGGVEDYGNNQLILCELKPDMPGRRIQLEFLDFDLENSRDFIHIYEGSKPEDEQLIGTYTGVNLPPLIRASKAEGNLSVLFSSDRSVTRSGFSIHVTCVPFAPSAPVQFAVDSLSEESLRLSWSDISDNEDGFEIWRSEPGMNNQKVYTAAANDTFYVDKNLFPATYYSYQIRAFNAGGYSDFSRAESAGTLPVNIAEKGYWARKTDFQSPQSGIQGAVGFAIDDKGYVLTTSGKLWAYDPQTGTSGQWIEKGTFPGGGRYNPIAMVIRGKAYVGLGYFEDDLWEYDPKTNTWLIQDHYPEGFERYQLIAFVIGNKGYVGIGDGEKDLWQFDPQALPGQQWKRMNNIPSEASNRYFPTAFAIGSKGYVSSGYYGTYLADLWEFDPFAIQGGAWAKKANLPTGRAEAVAFAIGDKGYLGTGSKGSKLKDFWEYDPRTNSWSQKANFGGTARNLGFGFTIREKGFIGGGSGGADFWQYSPPLAPGAPEAPDSLVAILHPSLSSVLLTWKDISLDEVGFEVYRSENQEGPFEVIKITNTTESTYTDESIEIGKVYYYHIKSFNYISSSPPGNQELVSVLPAAPSVPLALEAKALDDTHIHLTWIDQSTDETYFQVFRWIDETAQFEKIAEVPKNITTYTDAGLLSQSFYRYRVKAVNLGGESDFSHEAGDTTRLSLPPIPEQVTAIALSSTEIQIEWEDWSSIAEEYELYRFDTDKQSFVLIYTADGGENSFQDTHLQPGTSYAYMIRAYNQAGYSAFSSEVSTFTFYESPNPPSDLEAQAVSSYQIRLHWRDQSDNEQFFILEHLVQNTFEVLDTLLANQTNYVHKHLEPATTYYYRVKAVNEFGSLGYHNLGYSNQASATTFALSPPLRPDSLSVQTLSSSALQLSWLGSDDEGVVYEVYRKAFEKENFLKIATSQSPVWYDSTLQANSLYEYQVLARNDLGSAPMSEIVKGLTLPEAPENLRISQPDDSRVLLEWESPNPDEAFYEFEVERSKTDTLSYAFKAIISSSQPYYLEADLEKGGLYHYRVRARNAAGFSAYSSSISLELAEDIRVWGFSINPNPVQENLRVILNEGISGKIFLSIYQTNGNILENKELQLQQNEPNFSISINHLPRGIYTLRLYQQGNTWVQRFVKQ
ncbi:MAG: fibronectin type III domain-containing protein [Microscillaceae bacterium]|nr:fibronectin type III domain-containing protein [Microscillaceae bacterium]